MRGGYERKPSIFDEISPDDLILAFFPCTRFEDQIILSFRGDTYQYTKYKDDQKLKVSMKLHEELHRNYIVISKLVLLAKERDFQLVIENPFSEQHYLRRYWCIKPALIDKDRRENGDYFRKPTQYFFINIEPKDNFLFEPIPYNSIDVKFPIRTMRKDVQQMVGVDDRSKARSMIHPDYANRFIRQHLIDIKEDE